MGEQYVHATRLLIEKKQFLSDLDSLTGEIASLQGLHYEHSSFKIWQRHVKALLIHAFGERTSQVHEFDEIVFYNVMAVVHRHRRSVWEEEDEEEYDPSVDYARGLQRAAEQLTAIKDEVVKYFSDVAVGDIADKYAYDVFVSHANDNKQSFVDSLFDGLSLLRINIWYDSSEIDWGDNLKDKIMEGLEKCRFGIVVLSPEFIGRKWTETELLELLNRQNERQDKVVLPLLYNLTVEQMIEKYPALSSIKARVITVDEDADDVVIDFARVMIRALRSNNHV